MQQSSSLVLQALCRGSHTACTAVLDQYVPVALQTLSGDSTEELVVCGVLQTVHKLLDVASSWSSDESKLHSLGFTITMIRS